MAREVLGLVGFAVGSIFGPVGSAIGYALGNVIGNVIDPLRISGPGLSEAPVQTNRDGVPIPIIWGLQYCHGNILQKNPEEIVTTTSGGGGFLSKEPEVEEQHRYRTFAIGVCEGPIAEITRIWENNKLVYDVRDTPGIPVAETVKYAEGITIYLGGEDQLPDPELEAHWTAAETPAYKGLCYIVWNNYDLTAFGGAIPQFAFEVNGSRDLTVTSKPYPIEAVIGMAATLVPQDDIYQVTPIEGLEATNTPQDGELRSVLDSYEYDPEGLEATLTVADGTLVTKLHEHTVAPEGLEATITPDDGTLETRLISYTVDPVEGLASTLTPKNGTLI